MRIFKVLLYPLVKHYFAVSYQDNLLPLILAVCLNIFLFPIHKSFTLKNGKSFDKGSTFMAVSIFLTTSHLLSTIKNT